jgi:septum formation protein
MGEPVLVLASNSPRRKELLAMGGWRFNVRSAGVDESQREGEAPGEYVLRLAESKARACPASPKGMKNSPLEEELVIVAADTAVADGKDILGKPADKIQAAAMLRRLRGHTHRVFTGIAVMRMADGNLVTDLCGTDVPMRAYRDEEIDAYVATNDPLDKAGAYAIQNPGFHPVETLAGCCASVMGLPLCHLTRTLRQLGFEPQADVPGRCQASLNYACPISAAVLRGEQAG